jgi:16S rRNA G966 N2-methylase RsmD
MRIIAGQFKGRRLAAPRGCQTRPITDRVKVSLFGILDPWLGGAAVADLFCGTGSFGLEALSRGARHCWFAELDRAALAGLRQNIDMLGIADQATIWRGDILRRLDSWLAGLTGPLDVISLDPPYEMARQWFGQPERRGQPSGEDERPARRGDQAARDWALGILTSLAGSLAADGVIVLRTSHNVRAADLPAGLVEQRRREYGSMALTFLQHAAPLHS